MRKELLMEVENSTARIGFGGTVAPRGLLINSYDDMEHFRYVSIAQ